MTIFGLAILTWGCASAAPQQEAQKAPARTNETGDVTKAIACGSTATAPADVINGNQLITTDQNRQSQSLCQTLTASGKPVAIFQIAGIYCSDCQNEARFVRSQDLSLIEHVVVFTDSLEQYRPGEENDFFNGFTKGTYRFDPDLALFNRLSPGKADKFGTTLVLSRTGEYRVFRNAHEHHQWFAAAQELARRAYVGN